MDFQALDFQRIIDFVVIEVPVETGMILISLALVVVALQNAFLAKTIKRVSEENEAVRKHNSKVLELEKEFADLRTDLLRERALKEEAKILSEVEQPSPSPHIVEVEEVTEESPPVEPLEVEEEKRISVQEETPPAKIDLYKSGLQKSSRGFLSKLRDFISSKNKIDEEDLDELRALLISSDMGPSVSEKLISKAREIADSPSFDSLIEGVRAELLDILNQNVNNEILSSLNNIKEGPRVILIVGVNGAGKTTSIAKIASRLKREGKKVLLVAGDTFRAAAVQQLDSWAQKVGVEIYKGAEGSKPSGVIFDGCQYGKDNSFDVIIVDTAGRLQSKANLMQELGGLRNSIGKVLPSQPEQTWLVLDGSTGQNALIQAREFNAAVDVTGLVVTKLDSSSKGGIVIPIVSGLKKPVVFVGLGEGSDDLVEFESSKFVDALLERE